MSVHATKNGICGETYWCMRIIIDGHRIRKYSYNRFYLANLQMTLKKLKEAGGAYADALNIIASCPAPVPPKRERSQYRVTNSPMLYIYNADDSVASAFHMWELRVPWDGRFVKKRWYSLPYLQGLRNELVSMRTAGSTIEDARRFIKAYPKPSRPRREQVTACESRNN